ncbi:MAG: endopeptidase La [Deltaproteobacteria bacterium]|nr:endopeptidase La [Deltaproteobacteria bacterium]
MCAQSSNILVEIPDVIPVLPLRNAVLFPGSIIPIDVGRKKSVKLVEEAVNREKPIIGILTQKDPEIDNPQEDDLYTVGTAARILKVIKLTKDNYSVIIQGIARFELLGFIGREPYITAKIFPISEDSTAGLVSTNDGSDIIELGKAEVDALMLNVREIAKRVIKLMPDVPNEATSLIDSVNEPGQLADLISSNLELPMEEKQRILEVYNVNERLHQILLYLNRQLEILKIREKINSQVQEEMGKSQREYVLRQHLKAIKEELGELDPDGGDVDELKGRISSAKMPDDAEAMALKQLGRLRMMSPTSAEYSVTHTYIDWLCDLPWDTSTTDQLDISKVREILDEDHYDLIKVKKRIIEYLAVRKLNPDKKGPILCLVGPPGVGKTSLGRSIARAMGREFWRISLGGIRDEAEIRGHRRTYVGALPGRIIQGIRKAKVNNPIFMLDEIDKLGHDFRGDPSSALLEVLDPEQNSSFSDHYLEVQFDLSKVMFIATANMIDTIPEPLRDRMEILELPGYTRNEKFQIAKRYIVPRQTKENGLTRSRLDISDDVLMKIIENYTREAGVRNLERTVEAVCRGVAVMFAEGKRKSKFRVKPSNLPELLGPEKFLGPKDAAPLEEGVATGLAWTPTGGDIIFIESRKMKGKGGLTLTGHLGDVMKESAQAALSYIKSEASSLKIDPELFEKIDIHIHVPAGAVPKDGPSAGITMFSSLLSLITGRKIRHDIAMTGEITLQGRILPIGGIKEKSLAAHRANIRTLLIPFENSKDIDEIPDEAKKDMKIVLVKHVREITDIIFENPTGKSKSF